MYYVELANNKKSYFIRYKHNGRNFEERAGRSDKGWDSERSYNLREKRIFEKKNQSGDFISTSTIKNGKWNFARIFKRYLKLRPDLKGKENDIYRFKTILNLIL